MKLEIHADRWDAKREAEVGIRRTPAITVSGARDTGIRYYGLPDGYELETFLGVLRTASGGPSLLTAESIVSPMMVLADGRLGGILLLIVAAYQFTPLKRGCLDACRSPLSLITGYWRPGTSGAMTMGLTASTRDLTMQRLHSCDEARCGPLRWPSSHSGK